MDFQATWCFIILHTVKYLEPESLHLLSTFGPSRYYQEARKLQKEVLTEVSWNWKYPLLENLNSLLHGLTGSLNCLVLVDNFQQINFNPFEIPVVIRRPAPVLQTSGPFDDMPFVILGVDIPQLRNISLVYYFYRINCQLSKFLVGFEHLTHACMRINAAQFIPQVKSFSCQVHVGIFPSRYIVPEKLDMCVGWLFPSIFHYDNRRNPHFTSSTAAPEINVVIQYSQVATYFDKFGVQYNWIQCGTDGTRLTYKQNIYIALNVMPTFSNKSKSHSNFGISGHITAVNILQICSACLHTENDTGNSYRKFGTIRKMSIPSINRKIIIRQAFTFPQEKQMWTSPSVQNSGQISNLLGAGIAQLKSCDLNSIREVWTEIFDTPLLFQKLSVANGYLWRSILENFTIAEVSTDTGCTTRDRSYFAISLDSLRYIKSAFIFPYYTKEDFNNIRFVGCGTQGLSTIPFYELTSVYDKAIWLSIVLTVIVAAFSIRLLQQETKIQSNILSLLKMLLEQGGPFKNLVVNTRNLRFGIGILLLSGILLSNAYKNSNIYNMVIPRRPILYNYFHELLRDNFTIYSRSAKSFVLYLSHHPRPPPKLGRPCSTFENYTVACPTEVDTLVRSHQYLFRQTYNKDDTIFAKTGIENVSRLHDGVGTFIQKFMERMDSYVKSNMHKVRERIRKFTGVQTIEQRLLIQSLGECRKTAVLLPGYICEKFENILVKKQRLPNVFIGKELYSDIAYMFILRGLHVPPRFVKRVHEISESGIWHWWMHVLGRRKLNTVIAKVEAASMTGNIIIIFVVWSIGIIISTLWLVIEQFERFTKPLMHLQKGVRKYFWNAKDFATNVS